MTEEERIAKLIDEAERILLALQDGPLPQGDLPGLRRAIEGAERQLSRFSSVLKIPTFDEAMRRFDVGEATPLDEFVYDNEPADPMDARDFREGLQDVIGFVLSHKGSDE